MSGCSPLIVNFQDLSGGNPTSWAWDLGNGSTSTLRNPSATYFTPGTYTVRLTVTNANGSNTLTRSQLITVYEPPTVNFAADVLSGCFPLHVQLSDLSSGSPGNNLVAWQWDFGNGLTSTQQNPAAVYTTAGSYAVTLKVTNDKGCSRILGRNAYINVTPGVTAAFTPNPAIACTAPASIQFNNASTGPGNVTYQWNFGDNGSSLAASPSHTYSNTGSYDVTLVAISSSGCRDTAKTSIPVGGFTSSFQVNGASCPRSAISFTNTSTPQADSTRWAFGDGSFSTSGAPSHAYANPGNYTVWLYNYYGTCIDSVSSQVSVAAPPVANFNAPVTGTCQSSLTVNFQDLSAGAVNWLWDFGDNSSSTLQNPVHTYNTYGSYTVTLIVTNSAGCRDTIAVPSFVRLEQPRAIIGYMPAGGCLPFVFSPVAVINSPDIITSYLWDFGDGNTSTVQNPTHTYTVQGTYTVKLVYTTSTGCRDSVVYNPGVIVGTKPAADFTASPTDACASQLIQFVNQSSPFTNLLWSFGDGVQATDINPGHFYTDTGYFNVQLVAFNNGCPDTITRDAYIHILPPVSRFTPVADCNSRLRFTFTDQSILPQTWLWDFGDGNTSTLQNPVHTYAGYGVYIVRLTVTNGGCSHSSEQTIQLLNQQPDFTAASTSICKGFPAVFTPSNFNPATTAVVSWIFGDGTPISPSTGLESISHVYSTAGLYDVSLVLIDVNGCRDTLRKPAYIRVNGPTAAFSAIPPGGCTGNMIGFTDHSLTDGINALTNWIWDFGDGNTQSFTSAPFQHTYSTNDSFTVELLVVDAAGCRDSVTRADYIVTTSPDVAFNVSNQMSCPNAGLQFANMSTPAAASNLWNFGDGNTSTEVSPIHAYADTGYYTVTLTITDQAGCVDSIVKPQLIHVVSPKAGFVVNDSFSACTPLEVQFTNTSENAVSYLWDFGPGEGVSSLADPVHYFSTPGVYRVKLLITSIGFCQDSAFINITVLDTAGLRFNYLPIDGCNPLLVNFTTTAPSSTQSYFWDFGDGTQQTNTPNVSHIYQSFGNYLPKVVLLDPPGCVIPVTGIDTIRVKGSNIKFGVSDSVLCDAGFVNFTDSTLSSDPVTNYNWNFGDGATSTQQHPVHYFSTPGNYDVTLSVTTQSGCVNTFTKPTAVKVVARPDIAITGNTTACIYDSILHAGIFLQADTSIVTWQWAFPNGNSASAQNPPAQTYAPGTYSVFAYATNSTGCIDTAIQSITIYPLPTVDMPGQMTIAVGFADTIPAIYSNGVNQWSWTPPFALSCFDCPRPLANPRSTTTYQVAFSDVNGCRNTGKVEVVVICKDANFYIPNTFSPNGDGSNDRFYPRGRGLYLIRTLRVFNRWGEVVFENRNFQANDAMAGWDGRYKGNKAQPDVYVYQVEIQCDNGELIKLTGNIALIL